MSDKKSPCPYCYLVTQSIKKGKENYECKNCGKNKYLTDLMHFKKRKKKK